MNIIFIGMRGSGKTTISKKLAVYLHCHHIEMDELIEKTIGINISEFVNKNGWNPFREIESKVVDQIIQLDKHVISAGGGVVVRKENIQKLRQNGFLILLTASFETLYKRIKHGKNRPLLTDAINLKDDLMKTYKDRIKLYINASDLVISSELLSIPETVQQCINNLSKNKII